MLLTHAHPHSHAGLHVQACKCMHAKTSTHNFCHTLHSRLKSRGGTWRF